MLSLRRLLKALKRLFESPEQNLRCDDGCHSSVAYDGRVTTQETPGIGINIAARPDVPLSLPERGH